MIIVHNNNSYCFSVDPSQKPILFFIHQKNAENRLYKFQL